MSDIIINVIKTEINSWQFTINQKTAQNFFKQFHILKNHEINNFQKRIVKFHNKYFL